MDKKKILLVDDSETALLMERMILQSEPYELVVARDGQEAMDLAATENPDLILLDVIMPIMGGFEVCKLLRSQESTQKTPIVMVTTRGEEKNVEAGFQSGCNDYITKPINGMELLTKVRNLLAEEV